MYYCFRSFPDCNSPQRRDLYNAALLALDLFRYVESETMLGTAAA